jgi:hypothetical protein
VKAKIDGDAKLSSDQKQVDRDLTDVIFDVIDGVCAAGTFNGVWRVWSNGDGTLTLLFGTKVANGAAIAQLLAKLEARGGGANVQLKVDTVDDVEIHKLSVGDQKKEYPELLGADGTFHVATSAGAVWLASGNQGLERLKVAIGEAKMAGPKPGPAGDLQAQLLPLIEVLDKVRARQQPAPAPAQPARAGDKKAASKKAEGDNKVKAQGMLADLKLRKLALEAFKQGNDTLSLSLVRKDNEVELSLKLDEGIVRFVGKALSKFVKDNLADDP